MTVASKINEIMIKSSWIRKMFEEGARLKAEYGAENVFDFSLGNHRINLMKSCGIRWILVGSAIIAICPRPATPRCASPLPITWQSSRRFP
jgi:hypothetical protein